MMSRKFSPLMKTWRLRRQLLQVMHKSPLTRANLPIPSRGAFATRITSDLSRPNRALSAAAHLRILIICASRKAACLGKRLATSGSSRSVEAIIARFIATVMNATGGEKPALTRTLPHAGQLQSWQAASATRYGVDRVTDDGGSMRDAS